MSRVVQANNWNFVKRSKMTLWKFHFPSCTTQVISQISFSSLKSDGNCTVCKYLVNASLISRFDKSTALRKILSWINLSHEMKKVSSIFLHTVCLLDTLLYICRATLHAPADSPLIVILFWSPPMLAAFWWTYFNASCWSIRP